MVECQNLIDPCFQLVSAAINSGIFGQGARWITISYWSRID